MQSSEEASHQAHNLKIAGSSPVSASKKNSKESYFQRNFFFLRNVLLVIG